MIYCEGRERRNRGLWKPQVILAGTGELCSFYAISSDLWCRPHLHYLLFSIMSANSSGK